MSVKTCVNCGKRNRTVRGKPPMCWLDRQLAKLAKAPRTASPVPLHRSGTGDATTYPPTEETGRHDATG